MVYTGYLNTLDDFGLNMPPKYHFLFRQTFHCAPLNTKDYSTTGQVNLGNSTKVPVQTFFYGDYAGMENNATYIYPISQDIEHVSAATWYGLDYTVQYVVNTPPTKMSTLWNNNFMRANKSLGQQEQLQITPNPTPISQVYPS